MPTNIYLASLTPNVNCSLLTPISSYQQQWGKKALSDSEYSVIATEVTGAASTGNDTINSGNFFVQGTQILSVSRDVGIKDRDTYCLNIPLQLSGDSTIVYVQLMLTGTSEDSDAWYGSECTPNPAGSPWIYRTAIGGPGYGQQIGNDGSPLPFVVQQLPAWDSPWYKFYDSGGSDGYTLLPGPPSSLSASSAVSPAEVPPLYVNPAIGSWGWFVPATQIFYSLYICDVEDSDNDDLWIMIADQSNDPNTPSS
jgi:hypothetical protein